MRSRIPLRCLTGLLIYGFSVSAWAWGDWAHQAIALIAEQRLSPQAREQAQALLKLDDTDLVRRDLVHEANWADRWRDSDRLSLRRRYRATRQWHFVDLELGDSRPLALRLLDACDGRKPLPAGVWASAGPANDCLVDKIQQFRTELGQSSVPAAERLRALQFLLHFVGEIHQPLHASDAHDAGGHDRPIVSDDLDCTELHGCWDTALVLQLGPSPMAIAAAAVAGQPDPSRWTETPGTPDEWALESFTLARDIAYGQLPAPDRHGRIHLDAAYEQQAESTIRQQIFRAGLRLAAVLNAALGAGQ